MIAPRSMARRKSRHSAGTSSCLRAGVRVQTGPLVAQQAACAGTSEVPGAPVVALELAELPTEPRRDAALRASVKTRERLYQQRHGIGAEGRRVPAVERALGARPG